MNDAEPTIERLLAGLRDAKPQPGIENRVLKAVQAREAEASVSLPKRMRWQTFPAFAIWLVCAVAITGALIAIALHQRLQVPAESSHPRIVAIQQQSPAGAIAPKVAIANQRPTLPVRSKHEHVVIHVPDYRAASFPAPPLPLTAQEKLLLRVAHRRDPEDMAILNPALQATQASRDNEQFQQFFGINATEMRNQNE